MNKLRAEIVLFIDLFLVLLLGGVLLFYSLFVLQSKLIVKFFMILNFATHFSFFLDD